MLQRLCQPSTHTSITQTEMLQCQIQSPQRDNKTHNKVKGCSDPHPAFELKHCTFNISSLQMVGNLASQHQCTKDNFR